MLVHGAHSARVGGELDHRQDGVADDVALPRGEEVGHKAGGGAKGHHLGSGRRRIHEPQTGAGGAFSLVQAANDRSLAADLLDIAQGLFLNGGQAAFNVALGGLGIAQVVGLVVVHHLGVTIEEKLELGAHFVVGTAGHDQMFAAGDFRGFAEEGSGPGFPQLVKSVAHRGVGGNARRGVGFAALSGNPQLVHAALGALQLGGVVHKFLGLERSGADGLQVAVLLNAEAGHRLAGFGNAVHHALGPLGFDADNHHSGHVGVAAHADQRTEMQVQVFAELQAAVGVGQGQGALDVVGHGLAGGVGKVVQGQDEHMITDAYPAIVAAIAHKSLLHRITTSWF